jgi:hypothetical protein
VGIVTNQPFYDDKIWQRIFIADGNQRVARRHMRSVPCCKKKLPLKKLYIFLDWMLEEEITKLVW